jgi:hypothetical protein
MIEVYNSTLGYKLPNILSGGFKTLRQQIAEGIITSEVAERIAGNHNQHKSKRWDTSYFSLRQPNDCDSWLSILVDEETAVVANYFLGNGDFEKSKMTLAEYLRRTEGHEGDVDPIIALPLEGGLEPMVIQYGGNKGVLKMYHPEVLIEKPIITPDEFHRVNVGSDYTERDGPIPARFLE